MDRKMWLIMVLVAAVAVLATVLVLSHTRNVAYAQPMEGSTDRVVGIIGPTINFRIPLFVLDGVDKRIMVYEWDTNARWLYLRTVRSYRYDVQLEDAAFGTTNVAERIPVSDIRRLVTQPR